MTDQVRPRRCWDGSSGGQYSLGEEHQQRRQLAADPPFIIHSSTKTGLRIALFRPGPTFLSMRTRYTILLLAFALSSCLQEDLAPEDEIFRGSWDSSRYAIQIFQNGYGVCDIKNRGRCEGNVRIRSGKIIFISDNESSTVGRKAFDVDVRPTTDANGVDYMVLDGYRFERH